MKKGLFFLLIAIVLVTFAGGVSADLLPNPLGDVTFLNVICRIVNYVSGLVAALAVLMFVWAGILFATSAGNEGRLGTAKKVLLYAVIGVAIALAGTGLINLIGGIIGASGGAGCYA